MLKTWKYSLGGILLLVALGIVISQFIAATPRPPTIVGNASDTLTTPYGVEMTLVGIEQHGTQLLFHLHAYNGSQSAVQLAVNKGDYQFYYIKNGKFTPTPLLTGANLATHPAFPVGLAKSATADGWVMFDTAAAGTYPHQLIYRFGSFKDTACSNIQDKSTCHPDLAFKALVWNF